MYPELNRGKSPQGLAGGIFCMQHRRYFCIPDLRLRHLCRCLYHFGSFSLFVVFAGVRL